ncbi:ATP-dependent helicase [Rubripirellula amarantea]|nr:ATP-dependent helicase [Rubripirellula amarantea]
MRDLVSYLKWIEQPNDEVALRRIINTPPRGLGNKTIEILLGRAVKRGVPLWDIMNDPNETAELTGPAQRGIEDLQQLSKDVLHRSQNESLVAAMETLLSRTSFSTEVASRYDKPEEREARMASIGELTNAMGAFEDSNDNPDLTGFLGEIALSGREMGSEKDKLAKQNAVWLLTMHAAKGLEFPIVFMVGMEDGLLPHSRSVKSGNEDDIAEERRLCYVGITRAQETLTMSLALTRRKWGKPRPTIPSRFLYEIVGKADNPNKYRKKR